MKLSMRLFPVLLSLFITPALASDFYSNVTITQLEIETDADTTKPYMSALKVGYQVAQGLALEAQFGAGAKEDDYLDGKLNINKMSALFLRLGGQSAYNDVRLYLLVGRSRTEVKYKGGAVEGKEELEGNAWGIGAEEYSKSVKNMAYVLEYVRYNSTSDETITGIGLGLRYDF